MGKFHRQDSRMRVLPSVVPDLRQRPDLRYLCISHVHANQAYYASRLETSIVLLPWWIVFRWPVRSGPTPRRHPWLIYPARPATLRYPAPPRPLPIKHLRPQVPLQHRVKGLPRFVILRSAHIAGVLNFELSMYRNRVPGCFIGRAIVNTTLRVGYAFRYM